MLHATRLINMQWVELTLNIQWVFKVCNQIFLQVEFINFLIKSELILNTLI